MPAQRGNRSVKSWWSRIEMETSSLEDRMTVHKVMSNMAMFGREVMLPSSLMVKPPDEPVASSVLL